MPTQWVEPDDMESMAGTKLPPSDWMVVEQERINTFADCTEDHQFIHIDEEAAAKTPFGGNDCSRISHAVVAHEIEFRKLNWCERRGHGSQLWHRQASLLGPGTSG